MPTDDPKPLANGLEGRNCVPFFKNDQTQIIFEFFYLVFLFLVACAVILGLQFFGAGFGLKHSDKISVFSVMGGFLGGWVYDAKWFYRVTARGRNDQYDFLWQPHKFYWRILTPFLAAIVAYTTFLLATAEFLPIAIKNQNSARTGFAICFLLGYFSDLVLSKLAAWAEKMIPKD